MNKLQGKKTYLLCGLGILHSLLELGGVPVASTVGDFDMGSSGAAAELLGSSAVATFRMGLTKSIAEINEKLDLVLKKLEG